MARDPVREERSLPSRRKPKTVIQADADWKSWTFPKSRVSGFFVDFLCLERTSVTLLGREELVGLWHIEKMKIRGSPWRFSSVTASAISLRKHR